MEGLLSFAINFNKSKYVINRLDMKFLLFAILTVSISMPLFGQTQLGNTLNGEAGDDRFGRAVSISDNGLRVAISAEGNDNVGIDYGQVKVFDFEGQNWNQIGNDIYGNVASGKFGVSISLSGDGCTLAASTISGSDPETGNVRIFKFDGINWNQAGEKLTGDPNSFGWALSLSDNGNTIVIGSRHNDEQGEYSGLSQVYNFNGQEWIQKGSTLFGSKERDRFGWAVDITAGGDTIAIAALNNGSGTEDEAYVKVFEFSNNQWIEIGDAILGDSETEQVGNSIALSKNGKILAVGSRRNSGFIANAGATNVYELIDQDWVQIGSSIYGEEENELSSNFIALSGNGKTLVTGNPFHDGDIGESAGNVRLYHYIDNDWVKANIEINGENQGDLTGSVSLSEDGKIIAVGSAKADGNGLDSGITKIYRVNILNSIENVEVNNLMFFPNPVSDIVRFDSKVINSTINRIEIYNTNGSVIEYINSENDLINLQDFKQGTYLIKILSNEKIYQGKILKI